MNMYNLLKQREAIGKPIRVGIIGAGRYSAQFIAQSPFIPGIKLVSVAELDIGKAREVCTKAGWSEGSISLANTVNEINDGARSGKVVLTEDAEQLIGAELDIVIEVTGVAEAGAYHSWKALESGKHVITVTVEADHLVGSALKQLADKKGLVYSLGYGDQPACLCEQIDWVRTFGFEVVCAGDYKLHKVGQEYTTPDNVWEHYGYSEEQVKSGHFNTKMYTSFVDGTKTAIEMCSVANACNLIPQKRGLTYPVVSYDDSPNMLKPISEGGILEHSGTVEVPSVRTRDGKVLIQSPHWGPLWGVYTVFKGRSEYVSHFMTYFNNQNRILTDSSGKYSMLFRPIHILGLELGFSVAQVGLFNAPTGTPVSVAGDVVATAKKDLKAGDVIDGPGGYAIFGRLVPAEQSFAKKYLPVELSEKAKLTRNVAKDSFITYDDVTMDESGFLFQLRRKIEKEYSPAAH